MKCTCVTLTSPDDYFSVFQFSLVQFCKLQNIPHFTVLRLRTGEICRRRFEIMEWSGDMEYLNVLPVSALKSKTAK